MTCGPGAVTERMLVSMDWSFEKDVSKSGVHLGIGHPDGSLRPWVSKTEGNVMRFSVVLEWITCLRDKREGCSGDERRFAWPLRMSAILDHSCV